MTLIEHVDTINTLVVMNSGELSEFIDRICENNKSKELDDLVSYEFPNGVEPRELIEFCTDEQEFIFRRLGIQDETT